MDSDDTVGCEKKFSIEVGAVEVTDKLSGLPPPIALERCYRCKKRPATIHWVAEGGVLAFTHGLSVPWCAVCVLKEQVKAGKRVAKQLPRLEAKLEKLLANKKKKYTS